LGLTFKPLRMTFSGPAGPGADCRGDLRTPQTLYLILDFKYWCRGSSNREWFDKLQEWMKGK
jgi:hypothetical protein